MKLTQEDLEVLSRAPSGPAVSIFMPTHQAGKDTRENSIRFKNRLQEARQQLESIGLDDEAVGDILAHAVERLDDYDFWQHQREGLAMFLSAELSREYLAPSPFENRTVVAKHFHVRPLLPLFSRQGRFYILALSLNQARFFEAGRDSISQIDLGDTPQSLETALRFDEVEQHLAYHSASSAASRPGHGAQATFHGKGDEVDKKNDILRYFLLLREGVEDVLAGSESPLVFMGVDYLYPIYREANRYQHLLDEHVEGNPDALSPEDIHERAWAVVEPGFDAEIKHAEERFANQKAAGQGSNDLADVLWAAQDGRVDTLFVALGEHLWGEVDVEQRRLERSDEPRPGAEELLDYATIQTLENGGKVYAVEDVPGGSQVAAVYRY